MHALYLLNNYTYVLFCVFSCTIARILRNILTLWSAVVLFMNTIPSLVQCSVLVSVAQPTTQVHSPYLHFHISLHVSSENKLKAELING